MRIKAKFKTWMLIITGCYFLLSWMLSFSAGITSLESSFYQQLLALAPSFNLVMPVPEDAFPNLLHQLVLVAVFGLILLNILLINPSGPSLVFIILVVFTLLMSQILLALMQQIWLPVVWAGLSFILTSMSLYVLTRFDRVKLHFFPEPLCRIETVKEYIAQEDYNTAVLILKHCPFSDEMFELAYELGQKLEQQKNWSLARFLYVWLVQFDPGMQDFVERIDDIMNQTLDYDLSLLDITETRDQFGHFKLLGKKARGATATVYEAHDLNTHQRIALKIFKQEINDNTGESDIMTFLHEALTVSRLEHPNIVKIHDADIVDGHAYIAMDYIEGYPMSERLRRKKLLTAAESLRIMRSVLNALVKAHHKGIVHGDIKPANIMYDQIKKHYIITDFGAAYSSHRLYDDNKKIVGTPAYMSPEQLSGARIDGRSDLFSLAVTIYHLLTGRQPFKGEKLSDLKNNVLQQSVDLDRLKVPDPIKQVLEKALHKKTYQRFADASQMLHAVEYCQKKLTQNR